MLRKASPSRKPVCCLVCGERHGVHTQQQVLFQSVVCPALWCPPQEHKSHKAMKDALIEASKTADGMSIIFGETEGNDGALSFFGITAKVAP